MADRLLLAPRHRRTLEALLREHLPDVEVWAYGSRVNGRAHEGSDLDLVLRGPGLRKIALERLIDFEDAVRESNIPFLVEARDWARLPERFRREIERGYVVVVSYDDKPDSTGTDWVSVRLGAVCTKIGSGATPRGGKKSYVANGTCSLIRSQNVHTHRFSHDGLAFITERQARRLAGVEVLLGDVLINITGDSVARVCQVTPNALPARVNQHVAIVRPDPNKLSARFLRYFFVCNETQDMLLSWAGSGGTRKALTKGMLESLRVYAPADTGEQRAIAHILGTLDDKIELNRRMNETLEAMARALFKSWFVDFDPVRAKMESRDTGLPQDIADLFPDRMVDSELGEIPEGWEVVPLDRIARFQNGLALQKFRPSQNEARLPVVKIAQMRAGRANSGEWASAAIKPECIIDNGDVLFSWSGSLLVMTWCGGRAALNQHLFKVTSARYPKWFYLHALLTHLPAFRQIAKDKATTMGHIRRHHLTEALCAVPPDGVLLELSFRFSCLLERRIAIERDSRTLATLRDTLLPKLISGEIRVPPEAQTGTPATALPDGSTSSSPGGSTDFTIGQAR